MDPVARHDLSRAFHVAASGRPGPMVVALPENVELRYPGRVQATSLENPDFAALARAYGLDGQVVQRTADFPAAFERAMSLKGGALIELELDPEAITPRTTLTALRNRGKATI